MALLSLPSKASSRLLQRHGQVECVGALFKANAQHCLSPLRIFDCNSKESTAVDDRLDGASVVIRRGGKELAGGRVFEDEVDLDAGRGVGVLKGRFDNAEARSEDVAGRVLGPGSGSMAAHGRQRRNVVDVDGVGDEEDALDGIAGEGLAGGWVERLHFWGQRMQLTALKLWTAEATRAANQDALAIWKTVVVFWW